MKLYQALKLKNKIVGEIAELQATIQSKNSAIVGEESEFDLNAILSELNEKKAKLVELKSAISEVNAPIQRKIYEMSELKATSKFWRTVSTQKGKIVDRFAMNNVVEYGVTFSEKDIKSKRDEVDGRIEKLQEELDHFNHTTDIHSFNI